MHGVKCVYLIPKRLFRRFAAKLLELGKNMFILFLGHRKLLSGSSRLHVYGRMREMSYFLAAGAAEIFFLPIPATQFFAYI